MTDPKSDCEEAGATTADADDDLVVGNNVGADCDDADARVVTGC